MTAVRFATTCDRCGARSEEYTAWPSCRVCQSDTCPACARDGSEQSEDCRYGEYGDGERETVICRECEAE